MSKVQNGVSLEYALREILNAAGINNLKAVLSQTASAAREAPETSRDPKLQDLKILLRAIECNREIIKSLKGMLAQNDSQKAALLELMKVIEDKIPESLQKNSVPVFTEKVLQSPQKLAEILSDSNTLKYKMLLQLLEGFQTDIQSGASTSASEKSLAHIQSKIVNLVEIHREKDDQPGRIENPLRKLVEILSSMPQASRELLAKGEKLLETMLRAHLDSIKLIEKDIQDAIEPAFANNPIETLVATLVRTEKIIKEAKTDIEQKFLDFVLTLRKNLENCSDKDPAKLQNVSDVLKRSLETLERDIKPMIFASHEKSEERVNETVPRKVMSLLRSIEIQLRTLSIMPDDVLRNFVLELRTEQQGAGQQIIKHMEALCKELRSIEVHVANAVKDGFRKEIEKLEASLGKLMRVDIEPQQFRHTLNEIQTQLKEVPEFFQKVVLMERQSAIVLPLPFLKALSSIENSLKLLLQQMSQAIQQTLQEFSQNPLFKQLLEELTRILKFELPENDSPMMQGVKRIIRDIGEKLELHVQKGSPPTVLKEILQDALKQVERSLYFQKASKGDFVQEDLKFGTGRLSGNTEIGDLEILLFPGINILPKVNRENSVEMNRLLLFENLRRLEKQIRETIKLLEQFREGVPKIFETSSQPQMPSPLQ
ncbi:MAG: hypothetical protein GYA55_06825, partial [SAR324 cluster bacterium]|nr:hypothetical protein [SAR324 cluster bacterium]